MRRRQVASIENSERAANRLSAVSSRTSQLMESLGGFAIAGVVLYGGLRVIVGGRDPGSLFSFITSVLMIYEPMKRLARLHVDLSSALFGVGMLYPRRQAGAAIDTRRDRRRVLAPFASEKRTSSISHCRGSMRHTACRGPRA